MTFKQEWLTPIATQLGEETADKFALQILHYAFEGEIPDNADSPVLSLAFEYIKQDIDSEMRRKRGGAPLGNQNAKKKPKAKKAKKKSPKPIAKKVEEETQVNQWDF